MPPRISNRLFQHIFCPENRNFRAIDRGPDWLA